MRKKLFATMRKLATLATLWVVGLCPRSTQNTSSPRVIEENFTWIIKSTTPWASHKDEYSF